MKNLHFECVSTELLQIIETISGNQDFAGFRLCGGTALALQQGHRISIDADFVSENSIDSNEIIPSINKIFKTASDIHSGVHGVFLKINDTKVDFLSWNIPFIRSAINAGSISLTHIEEIIAMKLFAITQRGEKKDYMDVATLLDKFNLQQMLSFYKERHMGSDDLTVLRFLTSFSDIENQPEPEMLNKLSWNDCKKKLQIAVKEAFGK